MTDGRNDVPAGGAHVGGCLIQVVWSMVGPGLVLVAGCLAFVQHRPFGSAADWFLLGAVAVSVAARFLDSTEARPAGPDRVALPGRGKYVLLVAGGGALLLALAHLVAPRLL